MQALGICMGFVMIISVFFHWEAVIEGLGAIQVNTFLGIDNYAFFSPLGHQMGFIPIILALILILAMALAKSKLWRIISLVVALLCLLVSIYDVFQILRFMPEQNIKPGLGLWIFALASLLAIIAAAAMLFRKKAQRL